MTLTELREAIKKSNLRTGFDVQTGRLLIFTNGYQVLGSIGHTEQFSVHLNKHFNRNISEEEKRVIFKAIFAYVETPIAERSLPKEDE